ncbi:hypothetical protein IWX90DRAFT_39187 [Phyllosticta citrichinensis]|uniref:N-acetyltransferase domain-containing protein n=1 Tax=Phyllosticta citrichinensis TaxID=1130410 RepID=A0ABR1Y8L6_9PEZI
MDQLDNRNPVARDKFSRIQDWANNYEEAIQPKLQNLEYWRHQLKESPGLVNGKSTIPHGNRKRVPVQPGNSLHAASGPRQIPNSQPASQQFRSFPPHGHRPRGATSGRPQPVAPSSDHQNPTASREFAHTRPFAGRGNRDNRRAWKESSEQPDDATLPSTVDLEAPRTPNKLDFGDIQNTTSRSPQYSHPSTRASNVQLLHDNFVDPSPQDKDSSRANLESPKMEVQPKSAYIPPHLRNGRSAPPVQADASAPMRKSDYVPPHLRNSKFTTEANRDNSSASPKPDYVPPHLRNPKSTTEANRDNSTASPKPDYVPPHQRNSSGRGKEKGQGSQNASKSTPGASSVHQNGQAAQSGAAQPSEARPSNVNGEKNGNGQDDVMEVFRRPACAVPKNVWTYKAGKPKAAAPPTKKERGAKAFATDKEIREKYGKGSSPIGSLWANDDEGWDKVCGPDQDDPNYDAMRLVDWEGNWLPCVDWTYRDAFTIDPSKFKQFIQTWILRGPQPDDEPAIEVKGDNEIATRTWAAIEIDGMPLQDWWQEAVDGYRVEKDCVPWWNTFMPGNPNQLAPNDVPDCKVDRKDWEHQDGPFLRDFGSEEASKKFREKEKRKAERRRKREQGYEEAAALIEQDLWNAPVMPKINTKLKLRVRFAQPGDIAQMTEIYNTILETSVRVPERTALSIAEMTARWKESQKDAFAWLVAVAHPGRNNRGAANERILGFGAAADYHSINDMYRYTADIEVYVHQHFRRQGIGSCLMDRLMKQLSLEYEGFEGYDFVGDGTSMAERGGCRLLQSVIMNVPHDSDNPKDLDGVTKFLSKFNMKQVGNLPSVGIKVKKIVDLAIFHAKVAPRMDPTRELGL